MLCFELNLFSGQEIECFLVYNEFLWHHERSFNIQTDSEQLPMESFSVFLSRMGNFACSIAKADTSKQSPHSPHHH